MPPRSKNGSKISSLVSLKTREGGGKVEPARWQTSSQNSMQQAPARSAAAPRAPRFPSPSWRISRRAAAASASSRRPAPPWPRTAAVTAASGSVFMACIFIGSMSPCSMERTARERAARLGSDVDTLDGQRLQIRRRIFRIEHLAVEEGLLAARLRGRDIGSGDAELLGGIRQRSSRLTLAISALESKPGSNLPQRMSSVMNQRSWLWNG